MSSLQANDQQLDPQNIFVLEIREAKRCSGVPPDSAQTVVCTQVNRTPIHGAPAPAAPLPGKASSPALHPTPALPQKSPPP